MGNDADALEQAIELACRAHQGQRYPSPEPEPYILHLFRVMLAVRGGPAPMAAVLHDVLEDTDVTPQDLRDTGVPPPVVDAVVALTHRPEHTYEQYTEHVAGNHLARRVKLADLADNLANNQSLPQTPDVVARIKRYELAVNVLTSEDGLARR